MSATDDILDWTPGGGHPILSVVVDEGRRRYLAGDRNFGVMLDPKTKCYYLINLLDLATNFGQSGLVMIGRFEARVEFVPNGLPSEGFSPGNDRFRLPC